LITMTNGECSRSSPSRFRWHAIDVQYRAAAR
jgi:hypothetical protein